MFRIIVAAATSFVVVSICDAQVNTCLHPDDTACSSSVWVGNPQEPNLNLPGFSPGQLGGLGECRAGLGGLGCDIPDAREACYQRCLDWYEDDADRCGLRPTSRERAICYAEAMESLAACQRRCW